MSFQCYTYVIITSRIRLYLLQEVVRNDVAFCERIKIMSCANHTIITLNVVYGHSSVTIVISLRYLFYWLPVPFWGCICAMIGKNRAGRRHVRLDHLHPRCNPTRPHNCMSETWRWNLIRVIAALLTKMHCPQNLLVKCYLYFLILYLLVLKSEYTIRKASIPFLLMPWLRASPGHQQQWHWQSSSIRYLSCTGNDFNNQCHLSVEWW